jgi:PAS domain S-box-containing protein
MAITDFRPHNRSRPLRILLVEESEHDFLAFRRAFEKSRFECEITRYVRSEDALERLEADAASFDLVVTEQKLPGMSGLELFKELIDLKIVLPMVLLTGAESERLPLEALKLGFDDYLVKDTAQGYPGLLPILLLNAVRKHEYREEIKRAEKKNKTQAPYDAISENLTEMICRLLPDRTLTYVNDACCRYFSKKREELLGQSYMRFVTEEDQENVENHFDSLSSENPVGKIACRVSLPTGELRWHEWTNRAMFNEQGGLTEFQSVGIDISGRIRAEEYLRHSEDRYRFLAENVFDGFFVCSVTTGNLLLINKRACDLFGYPMQEALSLSIWDMVASSEHEALRDDMRAEIEKKTITPLNGAYKMVRKDGSEFKAEVSASVVFFQGGQAFQGVFRDIGEQEKIRKALKKSRRLEGVSTLASGVAHQFNRVLTDMTGTIGRLESDFPEDEDISTYVESIYDATQRMSRLSRQLLGFTDGGGYKSEIISLNQIIEETIALVQHAIDPDIQINLFLADDISNVEADAAHLQLALAALMTNTAEAIEGPGRIEIITKTEEIDEGLSKKHSGLSLGTYVCLKVEADGKGLNETTRRKLIEPLLRASFDKRGQGVATEPEIAEDHDDRVLIDIYFPASESTKTTPEKANTEQPEGKRTVLVIEDEESEAGITRAVLEKMGYHVLEVKSGMEAVNLARTFEGEIDFVFLDIVLPDMGGEEVYSLLMEARPDMKVIVCSGYANDGLIQRLLDEGVQAFIQKPFTVATVSEKLEEILQRQ